MNALDLLDDWCHNRAERVGKQAALHITRRKSMDDPEYRMLLGEHRAYMAMRSFIHGARGA